MNPISFEELRAAVAGGAVALRSVTLMHPAGGRGDQVYPATYADGGRTKYAVEGPSRVGEALAQCFRVVRGDLKGLISPGELFSGTAELVDDSCDCWVRSILWSDHAPEGIPGVPGGGSRDQTSSPPLRAASRAYDDALQNLARTTELAV